MKGQSLVILMFAMTAATGCVGYPGYYGSGYSHIEAGGVYPVEPVYPYYYNDGGTGVFYNYGYGDSRYRDRGKRYYRDQHLRRNYHYPHEHRKPFNHDKERRQARGPWQQRRQDGAHHRDRKRDHDGAQRRDRDRSDRRRNGRQDRERPGAFPRRHNEKRERFSGRPESQPNPRPQSKRLNNDIRQGNRKAPNRQFENRKTRPSGLADRKGGRNADPKKSR